MKTTIIGLFTLLMGLSNTNSNILLCESEATADVISISTIDISISEELVYIDPCYDVYFDPAIHSAASIQGIKQVFFQNAVWYAAPSQPANYPFHQVWCLDEDSKPEGTGNTSEGQDLPEGVDFVPQTTN
ncbi:MAG: hypothetical protein ACI9Y7_001925 [Dokdonia sp.]|jgi:hypothetical protein